MCFYREQPVQIVFSFRSFQRKQSMVEPARRPIDALRGPVDRPPLRRCVLAVKDRIELMNWTNELLRQFRKFLAFFLIFLAFLSKNVEFLQFSRILREIPTKFHQNLAEKLQNSSIFCWNEMNFSSFWPKFRTVFCWNFEICAVQRIVKLVDLEKCWKMRLLSLS